MTCDFDHNAKPGQRFKLDPEAVTDLANDINRVIGIMTNVALKVHGITPAHFDPCDEERERKAEEREAKNGLD